MEKLQDQGLAGSDSHQQHAQSFLAFESRSKASEVMGWTARTPSPSGEPYYASGDEIALTPRSHSGRAMILNTPLGSPPSAFVEPATPTSKHEPLNCFGLLTPKTPHFGDILVQPPVSPSDGDSSNGNRAIRLPSEKRQDATSEGNDITSIGPATSDVAEQVLVDRTRDIAVQQEIRDAALAASMVQEVETPGKRRSNRLAVREVLKASQPTAAISVVPERRRKVSMPGLAAHITKSVLAESSFTAEAVMQISLDINPALMTLDWQLQYPPGGSTHPSYAYPQMDPRLFFNPALVPIVDGLPTVFQVPPLALPMGWRHVSWSGFLPIAFDPYHQAFKLTPVGPLPLTCEEVQQGGLAKYVPGGEAHPEAGLLPDLAALNDGSVEEIYNFEDLDWVLPWPKGETFTPLVETSVGTSESPPMQAQRRPILAITPRPHCYEDRDCPDGVVDIEDAWRWLRDREVDPTSPFIPSPGKTWHGTGIHRTSRKYKAPIASLMGLVVSNTIESPDDPLANFLVNQNGREFCVFRSVATPVHVNITLLKDVEITLIELLSYFPSHYMWRKAADRFVRAGLSAGDIQNFINWSRHLSGDAVKHSSGIYDQIAYGYEETDGNKKRVRIVREPDLETAVYTTEGWAYTSWELSDYPLLGLAHGLKHVPEGPDVGPLTAIMRWCRERGKYDVLLSQVPELLEAAGIQPLIEPGEGNDPDKEVLSRHAQTLRQDRKRVIADMKERKVTEEEQGRKRKRVKLE